MMAFNWWRKMRWWWNEKPSVGSMWLLELTAVTMKGCRGRALEHMNCTNYFWDIWTSSSVFPNFRALHMAHDCTRYSSAVQGQKSIILEYKILSWSMTGICAELIMKKEEHSLDFFKNLCLLVSLLIRSCSCILLLLTLTDWPSSM